MKKKPKQSKNPVGRPESITPLILGKLEEVYAIGGTDLEACFYAGIGKTTLYKYQQEHPEFTDRKEALKQRPVLKARQTVVKALDIPKDAQWYLERKADFAPKSEVDLNARISIKDLLDKAEKNE